MCRDEPHDSRSPPLAALFLHNLLTPRLPSVVVVVAAAAAAAVVVVVVGVGGCGGVGGVVVVIGVGGGGATAAFSVVFVVGGGGGGLVAVVVIVIVDHMTGGLGSSIPGAISSHHGFLPLPQSSLPVSSEPSTFASPMTPLTHFQIHQWTSHHHRCLYTTPPRNKRRFYWRN